MKTENPKQIIQVLIEYIENTKDFVLKQAPDVLQQALQYEKISAISSAVLMTVLICIGSVIGYYYWKNPSFDQYGSKEMESFLGVYIPGIAVLLFFVSLCSSVDKLIKICVSPKYFLLQLFMTAHEKC